MKKQNLVIHENFILYEILNEISIEIDFSIIKFDIKKLLLNIYKNQNYLIII